MLYRATQAFAIFTLSLDRCKPNDFVLMILVCDVELNRGIWTKIRILKLELNTNIQGPLE